MKYLLSASGQRVLKALAESRALLAFDFDGTLAPLTPRRDQAKMRARTRQLLTRVCERFPCAVISGRSRADTMARVTGIPTRYVVGNHGLEPGGDLRACERCAARAIELMTPRLAAWPGVELENKRYSLALHYRRARAPRLARAAISAAIAELPFPMRTVHGKMVVNLVPAQAPHKGDALLALMARERAAQTLYVGDDVTDEDVFELDQPARLITGRVGQSRSSAASYFLRDQHEIDRLLAILAAFRMKRAVQ